MSVIVNVAVQPGHCVKRLCLTLLLQSDQDSHQISRQTYLLVLFKLHLTCVTVLFHSFNVLSLPDLQFYMALCFFLKGVFTIHSNWYGSLFMTLLCLEDFQCCNWWDVLSPHWEQTSLSAYVVECDMMVPGWPSLSQSCRSLGTHFDLGWN